MVWKFAFCEHGVNVGEFSSLIRGMDFHIYWSEHSKAANRDHSFLSEESAVSR